MPKEWECRNKNCGTGNDPQAGASMWKCSTCGALRWPWMPWSAGGLLVILLLFIVIEIIPFQDPKEIEEKFLGQVKISLQDGAREGEIAPEGMENLKKLAEHLKLTDRLGELIDIGKRNYLQEKRAALGKSGKLVSALELQPLCELAKKMDMPTAVQGCSVPYKEIMAKLTQGELAKAKEFCRSVSDDPQSKKLCTEMNTPLSIQAGFQYQKDGGSVSAVKPIEAQELKGLTLTNKDNYRLFVSVSQDKVFLYIFQKDRYGVINRLFPDPIWSQGVDNPLQKNYEYRIPTGEKEWYYLDELLATQAGPITETIYIIASPWRSVDIEELYGKIHGATTTETRKDLTAKFLKRLQLRNEPTQKSTSYKEFSLEHGK
ncbi:MAG: DUF4384 domain-containing protein [Deltaproteobacteria bacterium]|nr:DUF4384 domain-containing protein [Deltaproteobacteria bacterium]